MLCSICENPDNLMSVFFKNRRLKKTSSHLDNLFLPDFLGGP